MLTLNLYVWAVQVLYAFPQEYVELWAWKSLLVVQLLKGDLLRTLLWKESFTLLTSSHLCVGFKCNQQYEVCLLNSFSDELWCRVSVVGWTMESVGPIAGNVEDLILMYVSYRWIDTFVLCFCYQFQACDRQGDGYETSDLLKLSKYHLLHGFLCRKQRILKWQSRHFEPWIVLKGELLFVQGALCQSSLTVVRLPLQLGVRRILILSSDKFLVLQICCLSRFSPDGYSAFKTSKFFRPFSLIYL